MTLPAHSSFHFVQYLFVFTAVEWMLFRVVAPVIMKKVFRLVPVNVFCLDLHEPAVGVCVDQLTLLTILCFHLVVKEVVHQNLAVLQDLHAGVDWLVQEQTRFVHVDACQVVAKYLMPRI